MLFNEQFNPHLWSGESLLGWNWREPCLKSCKSVKLSRPEGRWFADSKSYISQIFVDSCGQTSRVFDACKYAAAVFRGRLSCVHSSVSDLVQHSRVHVGWYKLQWSVIDIHVQRSLSDKSVPVKERTPWSCQEIVGMFPCLFFGLQSSVLLLVNKISKKRGWQQFMV